MTAQPYIEYQCMAGYFFAELGKSPRCNATKGVAACSPIISWRSLWSSASSSVLRARRARHQRGQASTRLFVLGITSWASEKTQGGERSQPCLSPAASVSIKAAMTAVPEPGVDADDAPVSLILILFDLASGPRLHVS